MSEYKFLVTPLARLVRGSLTERAKTDYDDNPYEEGKGPFELGAAIRKDDPAVGEFLGQLYQKAVTDAPNLKQKIDMEWQSGFSAGTFRFKVRDGDKPNQRGQTNPNTVGHWVLNLSTQLPMKFTYTDQYGLALHDAMGQKIPPRSDIDAGKIKIGDFVHISISTKYNGKIDHTAGLYLSQSAIMLAGYGEAISSGPSLDEAFANIPVGQLPAGASVAMPAGMSTGGTPAPVPAMPAVGNTAPAAPAMPAVGNTAPAAAGGAPGMTTGSPTASPTDVQPHTQFLSGAPGGLPIPGQG